MEVLLTLRKNSFRGQREHKHLKRQQGTLRCKLTSLPTPTRDGYTFDGWYTAAEGGEKVDASKTVFTKNTTIYAHWTKNQTTEPSKTYTITIASASNGSVSADKDSAAAGETITLTVTPDKGYQLKKFIVTPSTVKVKDNAFTMPEENVTVSAVFEPAQLTGIVTITGTPRSGETLTVSVADSNSTGKKPGKGVGK